MSDDGYAGPAAVRAGERTWTGTVRLSGRFEPVDGRYHWGGRIEPDDAVAELLRMGSRSVTVQIGDGRAVPARLADVDPWGGVRVHGTGGPPWALSYTVEGSLSGGPA